MRFETPVIALLIVTSTVSSVRAQERYPQHSFLAAQPAASQPMSGTPAFDSSLSSRYPVQGPAGTQYSSPQYEGYAPQSQPVYETPQTGVSTPWNDPSFVQSSQNFIRLDSNTTRPLLDFVNRQSDKELMLMSDPNVGCSPEIILGAQFRASAFVAHTNRANEFSYLGRFPPDFVGNTATDVRMLHANQTIVGHINPWAHGYMETLFSDVFTFPTFNQGSFQMRQAYVTFGNLNESPWYAFLGKKTVNFGDMGTLSPFSQSMVWHYFSPLAEGAGVGFSEGGLNASVTALNGSRGIRVVDSEEKGHINNFAANVRYEIPLEVQMPGNSYWAVGGGYLHGTIYDATTAEHTNPAITGKLNGAWDVNTSLKIGAWRVEGEVARTLHAWPATGAPVTAWRAETAWDTAYQGRLVRLSYGFSEGTQGPVGSSFEFNRQMVLGLRYDPDPNVRLSFEYVRGMGFAPLLNITTVSDRTAHQDSFVFGLVLAI